MAIFADIRFPSKVQLNEKIRLDASQSFVSKGATAVSTVGIATLAGGASTEVYEATQDNWYYDFNYNGSAFFATDIVASVNDKINFNESGAELTATLTAAAYNLTDLAAEIKTQLDSAGAGVYTVSYGAKERITISSTVSFELMTGTGANKTTSLLPQIGFPERFDGTDSNLKTTFTGHRTEYVIKEITATIGDGAATSTIKKYLQVYSEGGDALFSTDTMLTASEPDILRWLPAGRSSWNFVHREAQELILAWLDEKGYMDVYGDKFEKWSVVDIEEFKQWSKFMTLRIIFEGMANSVDDIFTLKAAKYSSLEIAHRNRAVMRIDIDADGQLDTFEDVRIHTGRVIRR